MDPTRRTLLTTGAAAAAVAVVPRVFAQQPNGEGSAPAGEQREGTRSARVADVDTLRRS